MTKSASHQNTIFKAGGSPKVRTSWLVLCVCVSAMLMIFGAKLRYNIGGMLPITFQSVVLCLSALFCGRLVGFYAQVLYLFLGLFLPVFSSDVLSGVAFYQTVNGSFVLMFPLSAFFCGSYGHQKWHFIWLLGTVFCTHLLILAAGFCGMFFIHKLGFEVALQNAFIGLLPAAAFKSVCIALFYGLFGYANSR